MTAREIDAWVAAQRSRGLAVETRAAALDPDPPAPGVSEAEFQAAVVRLAGNRGWLTWHCTDAVRSDPGFPDLVLVRDRIVLAELKAATGRLRPDQRKWFAALGRAGVERYVWKPRQWPEILEVLR